MNLTHEDHENIQRARRISRAIQEYLKSTGLKGARSTDIYPYLVRKGLIEKDRHQGLHFRNFLLRLKQTGLLKLIPQCTHVQSESGGNEWYFYLASDQRAELNDIKHPGIKATISHQPLMTTEETIRLLNAEKPNIEKLTKRDTSGFTPQQIEIRKSYKRAYEYWSKEELEIMEKVYIATKNIHKVAELLCRQPHVVKEKLENNH